MKLELDALRVESFHAAGAGRGHGTVRGNAGGGDRIEGSTVNTIVTDESYLQTCIFYTCGGCTTEDPEYC